MIENILNITNNPASIMLEVAEKVKKRRLELNITQSSLAKRSDMSLSSYRRFETTGEIAFKSLVHIAIVLDSTDEFSNLFSKKQYTSIDDVIASSEIKTRKRGSKNE